MSGWHVALPARGGDEGSPPMSGRAWRVSVVGLHLAFAVVLGLGLVSVMPWRGGYGDRGDAAWPVAALAVLAVAYVAAGATAVAREAPRRAVAYLVVLVLVLGVVAATAPSTLFVLFIAYPQVWFLVEGTGPGVFWTLLLALSSTVGLVVQVRSHGGSSLSAVSSMVVGVLFSLLMGTWVSRVLQQSRERGALIAELRRTRDDLAAAHHAQGVMAERERLAREVHDTLAQGYTSIVVLAQTAAAELDEPGDRARERLSLIEEVARDNLRETRAIVAAFAPGELDGSTLVEALQRLTARFERETRVRTRLDVRALTASTPLSREQEVVLLRASQEALSNARRHANASSVTLTLLCDAGSASVEIQDDGDGFAPGTVLGSGLSGLRQRLEQAGGALDVSSVPGAGTLLAARLTGDGGAP